MQRTIFFNAVRIILNTSNNSSEYPDFDDPLAAMTLLVDAKKKLQENFVGLHPKLEAHDISSHVSVLFENLSRIFELCTPHRVCTAEEQIEATNCLARMSLASAHVLARRRSAMDSLEKAQINQNKRQEGRQKGSQARRKRLILDLYAQRRSEWENAYQASNALLGEAISIASGVGRPFTEDRAKKTIYEWFGEYDRANPRNQ